MKTCSKCGVVKPLESFVKDASKSSGYRSHCKTCANAKAKAKYQRDEAFREKQRASAAKQRGDHDKAAHQAWLDQTREYRKAKKAEYRRKAGCRTVVEIAAHKAQLAEQRNIERASTALHNAHVCAWRRARPGAVWSHRYRTDPAFNASEKVRARMRNLTAVDSDLQRHMSQEVKMGRFSAKWRALLGYTMAELVAHLQRTLPKRCRWEQFLSGELHIDHITPRAAFDLTDLNEVRACWSLGNLRLLCKHKNLAKGSRVEVLI